MTPSSINGTAASRGRGPVVVAVVGTFGLAAAAFVLSFTALRDLAILAAVPAGQAWLWPLVVDGVILEATTSVVALREASTKARRFAWLLLTSGAGVSVAANITHAVLTATSVPGLVAAAVASVPPLTLLAMTHLTVELMRNTGTHAAAPAPLSGSTAVEPAPRLLPAFTGSHALEQAPPQPDRSDDVGTADGPGPADRRQRVEQARALAADGVARREIAETLGVHPTTVGRWLAIPAQAHPRDEEPS
ncbi:DUF2637 domain-containing protein [Brevibacterium aurantiacum]|uniref:DUF2637 domain-containing protein n=1 Tax=Brevibacterium aurantiacum TaxID=273384 RepID=A0A2A3WWV2_BREAU|nr:DUF2637 domain-containing protein [Brevibacterium aurantiacum]PCC16864.1 hypothetical protein CIK79_00220 [Brevibacterium aurantiacum]